MKSRMHSMASLLLLIVALASIQQFEALSCVKVDQRPLLEATLLPTRVNSTRKLPVTELPFEVRSSYGSLRNPCSADSVPVYDQKNDNVRRHLLQRAKNLRKLAQVDATATPVFEHAVAQLDGQTRGVEGTINIWKPVVEKNEEYSLAMVRVVAGPSGRENVVEAGVHVFPERYGDTLPRLFITWTADGFRKTGCYNTDCVGFVQLGSVKVGSVVTDTSRLGSTQFAMTFLVFQDKSTGNWFFVLEGNTIGLWPAALFNSFGNGGTVSQWGGEVSNVRVNNRHTGTDMGSGNFANKGLGFAAFIRDIRFVDEKNFLVEPEKAFTDSDTPDCYSVSDIFSGADPLNTFFFYGGPGLSSSCS